MESPEGSGLGTGTKPFVDWGGCIVVAVCTLYLSWWWNAYLSPTVGHEVFIAAEYDHGRLLYRDYHYSVTPGWVLGTYLLTGLFGRRLIVFWLLGACMRVMAMWWLYRWLLRVHRPGPAALAVITTCVVSSADIDDFPGWYNYQTFIWGVLGGLLGAKALETRGWRCLLWAALAGLTVALNLLTKQTSGIIGGFALAAGLGVAAWRLVGPRHVVRIGASMLLGASLLLVPVVLWLVSNGLWGSFVEQVFLRGPSSKGGLASSLVRPVVTTFRTPYLSASLAIALGMIGQGWLFWRLSSRDKEDGPGRLMPYLAATGIIALEVSVVCWSDSRIVMLAAVYGAMIGTLALTWRAWRELRRNDGGLEAAQRWLLGAVGFATAFAQSISWPAWEPLALPSLAICLAFLLDQPFPSVSAARVRPVVGFLCLVLIVVGTTRKFFLPASWGWWTEPPISQATTQPELPELAGFRLSPGTARFYDEATRLVRAHAGADDPVLVYPYMPILYGLADRRPATFAFQHWPDVCTDDLADRDTEEIVRTPPAVIVFFDLPIEAYEQQERDYRAGKPCAQRRMMATIAKLVRGYDLVGEFAAPGTGLPVTVWARRRQQVAPPSPRS